MAVATELASSKIPKPAQRVERSKTPQSRKAVDTSLPPSRIPGASALTPRLSQREVLPSKGQASRSMRRASTPPPSSNPQDGDLARLRMKSARLSDIQMRSPRTTMAEPVARASQTLVSKERVAPGGRMSTPPPALRVAATPPKSRIATSRPTIDGARPRTSRETAECLRRSQSAGVFVTPRPSGLVKRGACAETPRPTSNPRAAVLQSSSSTASQRWQGTRKERLEKVASPPAKFSPPLRRASSTPAITSPRPSIAGGSKSAASSSQRSSAPQLSLDFPSYAARRAMDEERQKALAAADATSYGQATGEGNDARAMQGSNQRIEVFNVADDSPSEENFRVAVREDDCGLSTRSTSQRRCGLSSSRRGSAQIATMPVMMKQILQENRELRQRIVALEDGQHRFFGEGVFDLMNAAAATPGPAQTPTPQCFGNFLDSDGSDTEAPESGSNRLADDSSSA